MSLILNNNCNTDLYPLESTNKGLSTTLINKKRKNMYNIETYLYSLFGTNYIQNITQILNMIYNTSTKFTLHIWYNQLNGSCGKSTLIHFLESVYKDTFYEIPIYQMKDIHIFMKNIEHINNKKIVYVNNIEYDDIDKNILDYMKNMNIHLVLFTNNETKNNIVNHMDDYNFTISFMEFPFIFVNRNVTILENINIKKSDLNVNTKLNSIIQDSKYVLDYIYRKNNLMIPSKKRKYINM
jgi:hypothetical protein